MNRSQNVDVLFTGWFGLQAAFMIAFTIYRSWAKGAYYDLGPGMFMVYGFVLPAVFYLIYNLVVLLIRWWQTRSLADAWDSLFAPVWAKRSAIVFGVAFLVNLGYFLPRPW